MARLARRLDGDGWDVLFVTGPGPPGTRWNPAGIEVIEVERGSPSPPAVAAAPPDAETPSAPPRQPSLLRRAARQIAFIPDPQFWWIARAKRTVLQALAGRRPAAIVASGPP